MWIQYVIRSMKRAVGPKSLKALIAAIALVALLPTLAMAQLVDCLNPGRNTPAEPVPECVDSQGYFESCAVSGTIRLWPNDFRPAGAIPKSRDSTDRFVGNTVPGRRKGHELFSGVDVLTVNGVSRRLYVSYNAGLQIWDILADPEIPGIAVDSRDGWEGDFLSFPHPDEVLNFVYDVSAVSDSGTTDLIGVAGKSPVGPTFWSFSTGTNQLKQIYQDSGSDSQLIRLVKMNDGVVYAVSAGVTGLRIYNVTAAKGLGANLQLDDQGSVYPSVHRGPISTTDSFFVDTLHVPGGDKLFVATAAGFPESMQLWQVNDPQNPGTATLRFSGVKWAQGVAMFLYNGHYYLAVVSEEDGIDNEKLRIFMIDDCINGVGTCTIGNQFQEAINPIPLKSFSSIQDHLTYSEFDGDPYLYYSVGTGNLFGSDVEKLFELKSLRPPNGSPLATLPEITGSGGHYTDICHNKEIGYWSHYYHKNSHGLNNFTPRGGQFSSTGHFYRVSGSVLDVHVKGEGVGPGVSGITTEANQASGPYWMSDVLGFNATASGNCSPSVLSWDWAAQTTSVSVEATQISEVTDDASYRFDCVAGGRCPDATATVTASNGACVDATLTPEEVVVKDPAIDVTFISSGGRSTFERCEMIPLSANLAGRAPAFWQWRYDGKEVPGCSSNSASGDLAGVKVNCSVDGSTLERPPEVFADDFESGNTNRWFDSTTKAQITKDQQATFDLYVWDSSNTGLNPRIIKDLSVTLTETGTPSLGSPTETVDGASATIDYPASNATLWSWELEDPAGEEQCAFPGKPSVACVRETTDASSLIHIWGSAGTYAYRVTVSNCGLDSDTATGDVSVTNGVQPDVTFFNFKDGTLPSACCGNLLSGFKCRAGIAIEFQVDMSEDGSFAFAFDWQRTSVASASYSSKQPASHPTTTRWIFSQSFTSPGTSVYPIVRATNGGLSDTTGFLGVPIEIVSGSCN